MLKEIFTRFYAFISLHIECIFKEKYIHLLFPDTSDLNWSAPYNTDGVNLILYPEVNAL